MQDNSSVKDWCINDFHCANSMVKQRKVQRMSLHPYSREQKLEQIEKFKNHSDLKKNKAQ